MHLHSFPVLNRGTRCHNRPGAAWFDNSRVLHKTQRLAYPNIGMVNIRELAISILPVCVVMFMSRTGRRGHSAAFSPKR
ncbi:hypothetical protein PATSB16_00810 [Pandoraea thiooxydans]|nr:hypothetical protein PATSB16_00810 [Pandoraea thiooxydans]